jgi:hypothetical protein
MDNGKKVRTWRDRGEAESPLGVGEGSVARALKFDESVLDRGARSVVEDPTRHRDEVLGTDADRAGPREE